MNLVKFLHRPNPKKSLPSGRAPKILIVQIAGIGDLVLATPAIDALREAFPSARIDLLTSPRSTDLLASLKTIDIIYSFDIEKFRNPLSIRVLSALAVFKAQILPLRRNKYDAIISMNNVSSTRGGLTIGLLFQAISAKLWVGRNTNNRAPYFDLALIESSSDPVPEALTKLNLVAKLGASPAPRAAQLPISSDDRTKASELLKDGAEWVAIIPGANYEAKAWPEDGFSGVSSAVLKRGLSVVLLGGPGDAQRALSVENSVTSKGKILNLVGKLSLVETAAVLQQTVLTVTNDTGPMHIAAAVGSPLVVIYGPSNSTRYQPWAPEDKKTVIHHRFPCNPCDYHVCPKAEWCMDAATTTEVLEAVDTILGSIENE